jgi:hypothetical protein
LEIDQERKWAKIETLQERDRAIAAEQENALLKAKLRELGVEVD